MSELDDFPFDGDMHEGLRGASHDAVTRGAGRPSIGFGKRPCGRCVCRVRCWWHGPMEEADAGLSERCIVPASVTWQDIMRPIAYGDER